MTISDLKTFPLNQNVYHKSVQTQGTIGALYIFPTNYTPDDCFSCDGYSLAISDYPDLYRVVGTRFNQAGGGAGTFRIPNYNITGKFLQPGADAGAQISAGLPNITGRFDTTNAGVPFSGHSGAFYADGGYYMFANQNQDGWKNSGGVAFNASRSNSIYGSSNTVQPSSQLVHVCIKYK